MNNGQSGTSPAAKGEKKLEGCIQSKGGQYMLETKNGKTIPLTGQDVSAHVGHEVMLHGSWENSGEMAGMSGSSNGAMGKSEHAFDVMKIDHLSDTCKSSKGGSGMAQPK